MSTEQLVILCRADSISEGEIGQGALPGGTRVAIYNVGGRYYVTDDLCTHGASSLSEEGMLDGCEVECGWHFGRFDVTTGKPTAMPCEVALRTFEARIVDEMICIVLNQPSGS